LLHQPFRVRRAFGSGTRRDPFRPFSGGSWGFTPLFRREGQFQLDFCRIRVMSLPLLLALPHRSGLPRPIGAPGTMPSADFCAAVRPPCDGLSPESGTRRRPPEVSSTAFTALLPDLPGVPLMDVDFVVWGPLVRRAGLSYPVSVRQDAALLHASFRPPLARTPLRFASTSPPSGCAEDLHLQAVEHARHTSRFLTAFEMTNFPFFK